MEGNLKILALALGMVTILLIGKVADTKLEEVNGPIEIRQSIEETASYTEQCTEVEVNINNSDKQSIYKQIVNEVKGNLAESYIDDAVDIAADTLESELGIRQDMYVSFYGQQSSFESSKDIFLIIECTTKDKAEVKNLCNDYIIKLNTAASQRDELKFRQSKISEYENFVLLSILGAKSINEYKSVEEAEKEYAEFNSKAIEIALNMLKNKLYQESDDVEDSQSANIIDNLNDKNRKSIIIDVGPADR